MNEDDIKKLLHDISSLLTPLVGFLKEVKPKIIADADLSKYHSVAMKCVERIKELVNKK